MQVSEVTKSSDGSLTVSTEEGASVSGVDCLLWAVGREPLTSDLGLDDAGVRVDEAGHVVVTDDFQSTTARGVSFPRRSSSTSSNSRAMNAPLDSSNTNSVEASTIIISL